MADRHDNASVGTARAGELRRLAVAALAVMAMLAGACAGNDDDDADAASEDVVLGPNTKVLDDDSLRSLTSARADGTLTFTDPTDVVASLEVGDIVVAGASDQTPGGLMRTVESVRTLGDEITVKTDVAAIDQAIERGRIEYDGELSLEDADLDHPDTELAEGVELVDDERDPGTSDTSVEENDDDDGSQPDSGDDEGASGEIGGGPHAQPVELSTIPIAHTAGGAGGKVLALDDVVLHDGADGRVTASGSFSLDPSFNIVLRVSDFELDEFTINMAVSEGVTLRLDATGAATLREDVVVASFVFLGIIFPAGPLPVVITPRLDVIVTASGSITTDLHAVVVQTARASVGFGYRDGGFDSFGDSDSDFEFDAPTFAGEASARIAAGGRLGLCFWAVFCGYAQADGFVGLDARASEAPPCVDWDLTAGLHAKVGVDLPLIVVHVQEDATVLDATTTLDRFQCGEDGAPGGGPGGSERASGSPWARSYSGDLAADGFAIETTRDGGSIVAGNANFSSSFGGGSTLWVAKLDPDGDIEWEHQYGGGGGARAVRETSDGFYVAASGGEVFKLSRRGRLDWARRYTVNDDSGQPVGIAAQALQVTRDGGAVVAAGVSSAASSHDIAVVKIARDGDVDWSQRYGGAGSETVGGIALDDAGNMLVAGTTTGSFGGESAWALHLGPDGSIGWQKAYLVDWMTTDGGVEPTQFRAVASAPDGGFVLGGRIGPYRYAPGCDGIQVERGACDGTGSAGWIGWMARIDASGEMTWSTGLSVGTLGDDISSVTFAGSAVVAAGSFGLGDEQEVWTVQVGASSGTVGWSRVFGGPRYDSTAPLILQGGSQFIDAGGSGVRVVGTSNSLSDHSELWVLDMTLTGELELAEGTGVKGRYWNGTGLPLLTTAGPTGELTVDNRTADTTASPTDAGVRAVDITEAIEVVATRATVRTQAG